MATPNKHVPVAFVKLTKHFFETLESNVPDYLREATYKEVLGWVSTGPMVCTGNWYITFTNFVMVGAEGNAMNAFYITGADTKTPYTGSIEVLQDGTIINKET